MKRIGNDFLIFLCGGGLYCLIEVLWRGYTNWTMGVVGGICVLILYNVYTKYICLSYIEKCLIGSIIITVIEFISGIIINIIFGMNVWDYSNLPLNLKGQICLLYSVFWGFICVPIIFVCNKINSHRINL